MSVPNPQVVGLDEIGRDDARQEPWEVRSLYGWLRGEPFHVSSKCPSWLPGSSDMAPAKHGTSCRLRLRVAQAVTAILQTGAFVSKPGVGQARICAVQVGEPRSDVNSHQLFYP